MGGFWNACSHRRMTDADEDGKAVCVGCGAVVQVALTSTVLTETFEMVRRDFGSLGGRHSMRCVDTPEGWCCADDCQIR